MPPTPVTSPTRRFVVTRIDAGVETVVITSLMQNARDYIAANPGVYLIYSPCNSGYYTNGDRVWDSRVSDPL